MCYLITHGADPNRKDDHGDTPLLDAATRGHLAVVQYLLATIGIDKHQTNRTGGTALFAAASGGHSVVVDYLVVEVGCEMERMNRQGLVLSYALSIDPNKTPYRTTCKHLLNTPNTHTLTHVTLHPSTTH